mgnify:CR=1 FL=1
MKLVHETHKILGDSSIGITATAIRIPVVGGHSESVNLEFKNPYDIDQDQERFMHPDLDGNRLMNWLMRRSASLIPMAD